MKGAIHLSVKLTFINMDDLDLIKEVLEKWKISGELELRKLTALNITDWRDYFKQEISEIEKLLDSSVEDAHERLTSMLSFAGVVANARPLISASLLRYFRDITRLIRKIGEGIGVTETDITIGFPFTVEVSFSISEHNIPK